jgi:hypothetical protein
LEKVQSSLIVLAMLLFTAACASQGPRATDESAAEPPPAVPAPGVLVPPPTGMRSLTEGAAPIPGHPPVTMSGALKSVDPTLGTITFQDGRTAMLTKTSEVLVPTSVDTVRPGMPIVVRNALPFGLSSKSLSGSPDPTSTAARGTSQRMATVASVEESDQVVQLTDGTAVRVTPSTHMHLGIAGASIGLADLRPGDELVIVTTDEGATTGTDAAPSASPGPSASRSPATASELMAFRPTWTP